MKKTLVILCGGNSQRMGTDKALLPFGDTTLLEYMYQRYQPHFDQIYLSVKRKGDYAFLKLAVTETPDIYLNSDVFGGVFSSLSMIDEERAFFISVDHPFFDPELGVYMLEKSLDYNVCTIQTDVEEPQPFAFVFTKTCIPFIGKKLLLRNFTLNSLTDKFSTLQVTPETISKVTSIPPELLYYNMDTRASYYRALTLLYEQHPFQIQDAPNPHQD